MSEQANSWTPGPWSLHLFPQHGGDATVHTSARGRIALVYGGGGGDGKWPELAANARLIAAAPDLYVSLRHAVEIIDKHVDRDALGMNAQGDPDVPGGFQKWPLLDEYLHHMREALSKAVPQDDLGAQE